MRALFLHAFGADRLSWAGTTPALSGVTAITPDLPGHGNAVTSLDGVSVAALAEAIRPDLGGAPAWFVGHSLGGAVALALAAAAPDLCRGLVLLAPLGLGKRADLAALNAYAGFETPEEMRGFLQSLVVDTRLIAPQFVDYALAHLAKPGAREAAARIAVALPAMAAEAAQYVPAIAAAGLPVQVLWGTEDPVAQPDHALIQRIGPLTEIAGAGHILHVEAMARVNRLLGEWIR
ncbi:MAG: alpha/beta fold hydrolase [Pseudomonadota bacterium]